MCSTSISTSLPRLLTLVGQDFVTKPCSLNVIPDTGAEVTVAGEKYLSILKVKKSWLNPPKKNLKHVGGGRISVIGSCYLSFTVNLQTTIQEVHFIPNTSNIFLSITACKELKLIPQDFPYKTVEQIVDTEEQEDPDLSGGQPGIKTQLVSSAMGKKLDKKMNTQQTLFTQVTRPEKMPYNDIDENIPLLEKWLLETYKDVFNTERHPLAVMSGKPQHIHIQENAAPTAIHSPIPIPVHWKEDVKRLIDEYVGEPVEWCSIMVTVKKKDGSPRITVDYQQLNKVCSRETHPTDYPLDLVSSIPVHSYKTIADAYQGYHQVILDKESRKLTTFITEFGRYHCCRPPQGLNSSGDAYTSRYSEVLSDILRLHRIVDDTLLHDVSIKESFYHTLDFLNTCGSNGVTLNPKKFKFCRKKS